MMDYCLAEINAVERRSEWISKKEHDFSDHKLFILMMLNNIAESYDAPSYNKHLNTFKTSQIWKNCSKLQAYFTNTWDHCREKWVKCFLNEELTVAIYTNNGVERQNCSLKTSWFGNKRNSTITELVTILLQIFFTAHV